MKANSGWEEGFCLHHSSHPSCAFIRSGYWNYVSGNLGRGAIFWSSTPYASGTGVKYLGFNDSMFEPAGGNHRGFGSSVPRE